MTPPASPLISASELRTVLDQPHVKVFDVRGTWSSPARALPDDYAAGHIPGAVFVDWTRTFLEPDVPVGLAAVSNAQEAAQSFRVMGISPGDLVVLYDDYHHMLAGRIWWALRHWGFDDVAVLDGGWSHWVTQGYPVSTEIATPQDGLYTPRSQPDLRVGLQEFIACKDDACVLDARGAESYAGKPDDLRTGHIPDALNLPFRAVLDAETGLFLEDVDLIHAFDAAAPEWRKKPVISSCGAGYAGTVLMLALETLGVPSTLYDGSIGEWKLDPGRQVVQS